MKMYIFFILATVTATNSLIGTQCSSDLDCISDGWEFCDTGKCQHKQLWPLKELEFWGMFVVFFSMLLANISGGSGGGLGVPICLIFFKFDPKNAIALSNLSICISSFLRYVLYCRHPHPLKNGKGIIVDMNLAIIMLPLIISGVSIGVVLNIILPGCYIMAYYCILLSFIATKMALKTKSIYH